MLRCAILPRVVTFSGNRVKLEALMQERHGVVQKFEPIATRSVCVAITASMSLYAEGV